MKLRARIASALHSLAYWIHPQTWYARPDGLANVEFVRDLGADTFGVKHAPRECRKYRGFYPTGSCPATECEYPDCKRDGFVSRYDVEPVKPRTPLQRRRAAKSRPPVLTPGKGG